jgi:outer membrane lipoprotein-sorting protein
VTEGTISYKTPDKFHMKTWTNMLGGEARELFSSGGVVHTYAPTIKTATRTDTYYLGAAAREEIGSAEARDISKPFQSFRAEDIGYLGSETTDAGVIYLFDARPAPEAEMPNDAPTPQTFGATLVFRIHAETGLPARITMHAEGGSIIRESIYSNIRVDIPLDDARFEFTAPRGVRIVDLTEGALSMTTHTR